MRTPWWSQEPLQTVFLFFLPPFSCYLAFCLQSKGDAASFNGVFESMCHVKIPGCLGVCAFLTLRNSTFWKGSDGLPLATTFLLCKWKALNPDAQPRKTVFQKQHLASWQALPRSCLGSVALSLDLSRVSDTMASLAGKSRQLPISFGSPLILRNWFIRFHSHWICFSPLCPQEFQDSPNTYCFLSVPVFCMIVSLEAGWDPPVI